MAGYASPPQADCTDAQQTAHDTWLDNAKAAGLNDAHALTYATLGLHDPNGAPPFSLTLDPAFSGELTDMMHEHSTGPPVGYDGFMPGTPVSPQQATHFAASWSAARLGGHDSQTAVAHAIFGLLQADGNDGLSRNSNGAA